MILRPLPTALAAVADDLYYEYTSTVLPDDVIRVVFTPHPISDVCACTVEVPDDSRAHTYYREFQRLYPEYFI